MLNMPNAETILRVSNLSTYIKTRDVEVRAVDGVDFSVCRGEVFGIAGESGSGKSMTAVSILNLLPPHGSIVGGEVRFDNQDLVNQSAEALRKLRGNRIAMIFQDPMSSLNPVFTIGAQISESLTLHRGLTGRQAKNEVIQLLKRVGIPDAEWRYRSYPHEFSGGMRQRVMIAMALSCSPDILIADEPTTALDVTVERQILSLLQEMRRELGTAIILITHNLNLMAENCDRVAVMYAGKIVEIADSAELFRNPLHPYTKALLASMPRRHISEERLVPLTGLPPIISGPSSGCSFAPRCTLKKSECVGTSPQMVEMSPGHLVRCHLY